MIKKMRLLVLLLAVVCVWAVPDQNVYAAEPIVIGVPTSLGFLEGKESHKAVQMAVGEINALRSNYSFGIIPGEMREFGECDMEIQNRKAEPQPHVRGNIARIYFYMDWAYPGHGIISKKNQRLFKAWDKEDPVDAWECERCKRIEQIQGNDNPFVKGICVNSGMW